jgi:hypothetical protein
LRNDIAQRRRVSETRKTPLQRFRKLIGDLGARKLRDMIITPTNHPQKTETDAEKVHRGDVNTGFRISGEDFGFHDILGSSVFLDNIINKVTYH